MQVFRLQSWREGLRQWIAVLPGHNEMKCSTELRQGQGSIAVSITKFPKHNRCHEYLIPGVEENLLSFKHANTISRLSGGEPGEFQNPYAISGDHLEEELV